MKKIGFWEVLALVLGAQVGSGILILPTELAPFGLYTIIGCFVACIGAMSLAFIFSDLCNRFPKTGGPAVYANEAFGRTASFFTGWTYWLVSWISTSIVVIACAGYLSPFIDHLGPDAYIIAELIVLFAVTAINCISVELSGKLELALTVLKFIPLIVIPLFAIPKFNIGNFSLAQEFHNVCPLSIISSCTLIAFWGFIGVECATAPAGAVKNPKKNIPLAIVFGTLCAAILYLVNCLGIMGAIPNEILARSHAPFIDFAESTYLGQTAKVIISIVGFIICLGTLNAWTLASGQIALGMANEELLPKYFKIRNKRKSPVFNIIVSSIGIAVILFLTRQSSIAKQLKDIIDFSVISFLFIYFASSISYMKLFVKENNKIKNTIGIFACCFCTYVIACSSAHAILVASMFTISGLLLYPWIKKQKNAEVHERN